MQAILNQSLDRIKYANIILAAITEIYFIVMLFSYPGGGSAWFLYIITIIVIVFSLWSILISFLPNNNVVTAVQSKGWVPISMAGSITLTWMIVAIVNISDFQSAKNIIPSCSYCNSWIATFVFSMIFQLLSALAYWVYTKKYQGSAVGGYAPV